MKASLPAPSMAHSIPSERVLAATARVVAKHSPALTPEFVYRHVLPDVATCSDWLSSLIDDYSRTGAARVASLHRLRAIAARISV